MRSRHESGRRGNVALKKAFSPRGRGSPHGGATAPALGDRRC